MPIKSAKVSFPRVTFFDEEKAVGIAKVNLGKDLALTKTIQILGDKGQWISVLDSDGIEASVVDGRLE